jgi:hypothetical protein
MKKFGLVVLVLMAWLPLSAQSVKPEKAPVVEKVEKSPITQEALEARLADLERGRVQAIANLNAYDGAIQECNYWLGQLKAAEEARKASPPSKAPAKKEEKKP